MWFKHRTVISYGIPLRWRSALVHGVEQPTCCSGTLESSPEEKMPSNSAASALLVSAWNRKYESSSTHMLQKIRSEIAAEVDRIYAAEVHEKTASIKRVYWHAKKLVCVTSIGEKEVRCINVENVLTRMAHPELLISFFNQTFSHCI